MASTHVLLQLTMNLCYLHLQLARCFSIVLAMFWNCMVFQFMVERFPWLVIYTYFILCVLFYCCLMFNNSFVVRAWWITHHAGAMYLAVISTGEVIKNSVPYCPPPSPLQKWRYITLVSGGVKCSWWSGDKILKSLTWDKFCTVRCTTTLILLKCQEFAIFHNIKIMRNSFWLN